MKRYIVVMKANGQIVATCVTRKKAEAAVESFRFMGLKTEIKEVEYR